MNKCSNLGFDILIFDFVEDGIAFISIFLQQSKFNEFHEVDRAYWVVKVEYIVCGK
jgi:hypothetical protein